MEENIHLSEYDIQYLQNKTKYLFEIEKEFKSTLDDALDKEYAKLKVFNEIGDRIHKLCTDHFRDVKNYFKKDLLDNFEGYLKLHKENPVLKYISDEVPRLIEIHLDKMTRSEYSYSFEKDFIKASPEQIIDSISKFKAFQTYQNSLFYPTTYKAEGVLIDPIILCCKLDKVQIQLKTIYDNLYLKVLDVSYEEFCNHFQNKNVITKMKWKLSEALLVYLFDKLRAENLISNSNIYTIITEHFLNLNNKPFKITQLEIVYQKLAGTTKRNQIIADHIITELKKLS